MVEITITKNFWELNESVTEVIQATDKESIKILENVSKEQFMGMPKSKAYYGRHTQCHCCMTYCNHVRKRKQKEFEYLRDIKENIKYGLSISIVKLK